MVFVLEGADGTGKTTLANEIAKQRDAVILHPTYNPAWNMEAYHAGFARAAQTMDAANIDVVLDRWAPSEAVYGRVFRGGESYDTEQLIRHFQFLFPITFIYCRNDNAVKNHLKNRLVREEMYDSMDDVVIGFVEYVTETPWLQWITYDYDQVDKKKFVRQLP